MGDSAQSKAWHAIRPYVVAGSSGMLSMVLFQPIDTIKVRLQLEGEGSRAAGASIRDVVLRMVKTEGRFSVYSGLSAGLLRQATYTTARMGVYNAAREKVQSEYYPGQKIPGLVLVGMGLTAGGIGAVVGTPADLALIRMQADGTLPVDQRRNYRGVGDALKRIAKEEGVLGLWKGCAPTVVRAMAVNMTLFPSFDKGKEYLESQGYSLTTARLLGSALAGLCASVSGLPFDFVKTRIQKQKPDADGKLPYKNAIDCVRKTILSEGPLAFYKGFGAFYVRIAPVVMVQLIVNDFLTGFLKKLEGS